VRVACARALRAQAQACAQAQARAGVRAQAQACAQAQARAGVRARARPPPGPPARARWLRGHRDRQNFSVYILRMVTIQIGENPDKIRQWASCGEHRVEKSKGDPAFALARRLIAAGYAPGDPLEIVRGKMVCLRFSSLAVAAGLVVEEDDRGRYLPRFRKFKPYGGPGHEPEE